MALKPQSVHPRSHTLMVETMSVWVLTCLTRLEPFHFMSEHRLSATLPLDTVLGICFQIFPFLSCLFYLPPHFSASHVSRLSPFPCGFHLSASLRMWWVFRYVWPVQLHFLFLICLSIDSWLFLSHNALLLIVASHHIPWILLRRLFTKLWIVCSMDFVTRHLSEPFISTALSIEFKMHSFRMLLSTKKAALAFPILAVMSQCVLPFVSATLPRSMKDSTFSGTSPGSIITLFFLPFIVLILVFTCVQFEYNRYLSSSITYHSFCNNRLLQMDAECYSVVRTRTVFTSVVPKPNFSSCQTSG